MKKICIFAIICMIFVNGLSFSYVNAQDKAEMRAVWITTIYNQDWPSASNKNNIQAQKEEFIKILDDIKSLGFNAVVVQVRPKGDALYQSSLNPWSDVLTGTQGKNPGYDPLKFMIDEAHKRGIELHAWLNPYRVTTSGTDLNNLSSSSFARKNPSTVMAHEWTDNGISKSALVYNPGLPEVRKHIVDTVKEIVNNYDVDAIHFDDYFYPNGNYNDDTAYNTYGKGMNKDDWRRQNVNTLVKEVYQTIKSIDSSVEFGISPRGIWKNSSSDSTGSDTNGAQSYYDIYCDTRTWIKNGWLDYVTPQIYWNIGYKVADYSKLVKWWSNEVKNTKTKLYIGQGIYKDNVAEEIDKQINLNRTIDNIQGSMYFSYRDIKSNRKNLREKVSKLYSTQVQTPTNKPHPEQGTGILYQAHGEDYGWQSWKSNGEMAGTTSQKRRVEAIKIKIADLPEGANIKYRVHGEDYGWQSWKSNGEMAGTTSQSRRIEAIEIKLENAPGYSVEYRVHGEGYGWQTWKSNGEMAGTISQSKRIEAIEIKLVKQDNMKVEYRAHGEGYGWQSWKSNGEMAGTTSQSRRLEAIGIKIDNLPKGANIKYRVHGEDYGWQSWKSNGEIAGTTSQSKRIEAIEIKLENAPGYSVEYRAHGEGYGWQSWKRDGEMAGTTSQSKRVEAIEARIVKK